MENYQDAFYKQNANMSSDPHHLDFGPTDSEITLCRVKRENSHAKKHKVNHWEVMHDSAIPGDGTHLGESPSLVNLVTLVEHVPNETGQKSHEGCLEYMVPLSSWEPTERTIEESQNDANSSSMTIATYEDITKHGGLNNPGTSKVEVIDVHSLNVHNLFENALESSKSVEREKSTSSLKDLFKCMAFWKRKSREYVNDEIDSKESINSKKSKK